MEEKKINEVLISKENSAKNPLQESDGEMIVESQENENSWSHLHQYRYEWNFGHYLAVLSLSEDGRLIATCGDEKFSVFDIQTQKLVFNDAFERSVKVTAFNHSSTHLAYGLKSLIVRETEGWTIEREIEVDKRIYNIRFSKDDKKCFVTMMDEIRVYETDQYSLERTFTVEGTVKAFDICSKGENSDEMKYLAYGGKDYGFVIVDYEKLGNQDDLKDEAIRIAPAFHHDFYPRICCFSPDAQHVAWGGHKKVLVMEIEKPTDVREMPVDPDKVKTRAMHFSKDSRHLVYGGVNTSVFVVDVMSGEKHFVFEGFSEGIWDAKFSPDGAWVVACSYNKKMSFLRLGNPRCPPTYTIHRDAELTSVNEVFFSSSADSIMVKSNGKMLKASLNQEGLFKQMDLSEHFQTQKKAIGYISSSGTYAAWMPEFDGQGKVVDIIRNTEACNFDHGDMQAHNVCIDQNEELVISDGDGTVFISDLLGNKLYSQVFEHGTTYVTFSSCSNYIAVCSGSNIQIVGFEKRRAQLIDELLPQKATKAKKKLTHLSLSSNRDTIEELIPREKEFYVGEHEDYTRSCAFIPQNSRQLASCSVDCTVCIWDLDHRKSDHLSDESDEFIDDGVAWIRLVPLAVYNHASVVENVVWSQTTPGVLLSYTDKGVVSMFDVQHDDGKGGRVYIKKTEGLVAAGFTSMTKQTTSTEQEMVDNLIIVTKDNVITISVDLILMSGPTVDCFIDGFDVDKKYLITTLSRFPYLGSTTHSLGPNVAERCVYLDSTELIDAVLSVCPGAAFANEAKALKCALEKGNKNMLMKLLMAAMKEGVSHKGREEIMKHIVEILEKAPEVLAEVLKNTGMEMYAVEGLKYAHLTERELRPSHMWGCGNIWQDLKREYYVRKALDSKDASLAREMYDELGENAKAIFRQKPDPINKVALYRIPLPGLADMEVLDAWHGAGVLELFDNKMISCVLSCLWKEYFQKRFLLLFLFHFSMFVINLASAIANNVTQGEDEQSNTAIGLSICLIAISSYNIVFEVTQLYKGGISDALRDFWSYIDWTYYTSVFVAGILSVTFTTGYKQLGACNVILSSLEMLFYMRGFKAVGFLISAITQAVFDLGPFLTITLILLLAFSGSFYCLVDLSLLSDSTYDQWWKYLLHSYFAMLGIVFSSDFFEASIAPPLSMALFVIFILLTLIIMLNLIISILCATFSAVQLNGTAEGLRERCAIILELSYYMKRSQFNYVSHHFKWIHVMAPVSSGTDEDTVDTEDKSVLGGLIERAKLVDDQVCTVAKKLQESKEKLLELEDEMKRANHIHTSLMSRDNANHLGGHRANTVKVRFFSDRRNSLP